MFLVNSFSHAAQWNLRLQSASFIMMSSPLSVSLSICFHELVKIHYKPSSVHWPLYEKRKTIFYYSLFIKSIPDFLSLTERTWKHDIQGSISFSKEQYLTLSKHFEILSILFLISYIFSSMRSRLHWIFETSFSCSSKYLFGWQLVPWQARITIE